MKKQVLNVEYAAIRDFLDVEIISDDFMIFDNISKPIQTIALHARTPFPVRIPSNVVVLCKKGFLKIRIGFNEYSITGNNILAILSEQIFQIIDISADFDAGYILLTNKFLDIQYDFINALNLRNMLVGNPVFKLSQEDMTEMLLIFNLIKDKIHKSKGLYLSQIVQHYFRIMFYTICDILNKNYVTENKTHKEKLFEQFITELQRNFKKEHTTQFYAEKLCLTPKYMSTLIYEVSEKHAGEWIRDYIVLEAKALLKSTTMTIQQVSDELGFANQSHFGRFFKRYTGVSPKKYREK